MNVQWALATAPSARSERVNFMTVDVVEPMLYERGLRRFEKDRSTDRGGSELSGMSEFPMKIYSMRRYL